MNGENRASAAGDAASPPADPPPPTPDSVGPTRADEGHFGSPPPLRRLLGTWRWICAVVAVLLFASQLLEIPHRSALRGYDNTFNYLWLRSALVDGDWDFRNDLAECNTLVAVQRASALALPRTATGRIPDKYGIGWSVLTLPFYLVADALVSAGRAIGLWSLSRDGFNPVYQICICLGQALLAMVSLRLAAACVRQWLGIGAFEAGSAVVLVWAASPLLYYQTVDLGMSHGAAFFAVALMAWALMRARPAASPAWPWLVAGAAWGLAAVTRFELALFVLLPAWALLRVGREAPRRLVRAAGAFAVGAVPFLLAQLWAWRVVYGRWFVFSYGFEGEGFHWTHPQLWGALFSPWHGLYYWHPLLLVASVGLLSWCWRSRGESAVWLVTVVAAIYLNAAWWCWWLASAFGWRTFDAALLPLMAGFAWLARRLPPSLRAALWSVAIAANLWNFYVVLLYRTNVIPHNEPVTWLQMLTAADRLPAGLHF